MRLFKSYPYTVLIFCLASNLYRFLCALNFHHFHISIFVLNDVELPKSMIILFQILLRMASAISLDSEERNYTRIVLLLMRCNPKVMRQLLLDYVNNCGQNLNSFLASRKNQILTSPISRRNRTILFPTLSSNPQTDIEKWDFSLLVHILKTQCRNLSASMVVHLNNIVDIRNNIFHSPEASMDQQTYNDYKTKIMESIDEACCHMNDTKFRSRVDRECLEIERGKFVDEVPVYQSQFQLWSREQMKISSKIELEAKGKPRHSRNSIAPKILQQVNYTS